MGSNSRHSNLRNGKLENAPAPGIQNSAKISKKSVRDHSLPASINLLDQATQKFVKPSELSLDLIMPSGVRGAKQSPLANQSLIAMPGAQSPGSTQAPKLNNLRTPQNQGVLQPL